MSYTPTGVTAGTLVDGGDSRIGAGGPSYGLTPTNFKRWRKATAKVRTGEGYAKLLCIGDSTTFGEGGTFGTNPVYRNCWPKRLQELLNSYYLPAAVGLSTGGTGLPVPDSRYTLGSGWQYDTPNFGMGNVLISGNGGAAGTFTYQPGYTCDTFDIYYGMLSGSFCASSVTIDGGGSTSLPSTGTGSIAKVTKTAALNNTHSLVIASPTSTGGFNKFFLLGIDAYDSTTPSVRVGLAGVALSKTSDWANTGGVGSTGAIRSIPMIQAYAPDLAIINLGINDGGGAVSSATYQTNMAAIISAVQASGDVLISSVVPSSDGKFAYEQLYQAANPTLATTYGCGVVDILARFVDYTTANAAGYMYDGNHPTGAGYADIAQAYFNALKTI